MGGPIRRCSRRRCASGKINAILGTGFNVSVCPLYGAARLMGRPLDGGYHTCIN
jgi:hypothetical protein